MTDFPLILDMSHYQPVLDIETVKRAGVVGIIHKATQYTAAPPVDQYYFAHKKQALDAGLLWGAYCFGDPGDGAVQADFFLKTVQPDGNTLLVLDLESGMNLQGAEQFISQVYKVTGVYAWLYSSKLILESFIGKKSSVLTQCPLWLAGSNPSTPYPWANWLLWQYGYMNFGNETFDANKFNGSLDDLKKVWKLASPNTQLTDTVRVIGARGVPVYQGPGLSYPVVNFYEAASYIQIMHGSAFTKEDAEHKGVFFVQTPLDSWVRLDDLQVADNTNPPIPADYRYVFNTDSFLNIRETTLTNANGAPVGKVLAQPKDGTKITVTGLADTSKYKWIKVIAIEGTPVSGYASTTYLTTTPPK